jgi:hypothetical protein
MREREIIRVCIDDDGRLDVTVARLCPEAKAGRLANEVAEAVVRLVGERALRDFRDVGLTSPVTH